MDQTYFKILPIELTIALSPYLSLSTMIYYCRLLKCTDEYWRFRFKTLYPKHEARHIYSLSSYTRESVNIKSNEILELKPGILNFMKKWYMELLNDPERIKRYFDVTRISECAESDFGGDRVVSAFSILEVYLKIRKYLKEIDVDILDQDIISMLLNYTEAYSGKFKSDDIFSNMTNMIIHLHSDFGGYPPIIRSINILGEDYTFDELTQL